MKDNKYASLSILFLITINFIVSWVMGINTLNKIGTSIIVILQITFTLGFIFLLYAKTKKSSFVDTQLANFLIKSKSNFLLKLQFNGTINYYNTIFSELFVLNNLLNKDFQFLLHKDDIVFFNDALDWCKLNPNNIKSIIIRLLDKTGQFTAVNFEFFAPLNNNKADECICIGNLTAQSGNISFENKINQNKELIETIIGNQNYFFWVYDIAQNKRIYTSKSSLNVFGYTSDELTMQDDLSKKIFLEKEFINYTKLKEKVLDEGKGFGNFKIVRKNESIGYVNIIASVYIDSITNKKYFLGFTYDITEDFKNRKEIIKNNQKINHLLSTISDKFVALDINNKIIYANEIFIAKNNLGSLEDIVGLDLFLLPTKSNNEAVKKAIEDAIFTNNKTNIKFATNYKEWYNVIIYPGNNFVTLLIRDITEEVNNTILLKEQDRVLNNILSNTQEMIWSVDKEYKLTFCNKAFTNMYFKFFNVEPRVGDEILFSQFGSKSSAYWKLYYDSALSGKSHKFIRHISHTISIVDYFEYSMYPLFNDYEIIGVSVFCANITERKLQELKIENQNKRFKEISWMQSHEVRKPLANILGLSSLFNKEDCADPLNQEIIGHMNELAIELDSYIRKIVDKAYDMQSEFKDEED